MIVTATTATSATRTTTTNNRNITCNVFVLVFVSQVLCVLMTVCGAMLLLWLLWCAILGNLAVGKKNIVYSGADGEFYWNMINIFNATNVVIPRTLFNHQ